MSKWIICASGPSMSQINLAKLRRYRSWRVMVINNTWQLLPWAHALYASDRQWWDKYGHGVHFAGERWTRDPMSAQRFGARLVRTGRGQGLCTEPLTVNAGGNSGFQAINLAFHLGAKRIVLLGYDMHRRDGGHWHGEHDGMLSAPELHILAWREAMRPMARDLASAGVDVVNCTPGTALEAFPKGELFEALSQ